MYNKKYGKSKYKGSDVMDFLAKTWKKIGMLIVIIACLFNIVSKLVAKIPYMDQLEETAQHAAQQENSDVRK